MIIYTDGDLFESPAKVLVNTVNTRGVMGKGIALRFKQIYPEMFCQYRIHCQHRQLKIGNLLLYKTSHKWVLNFPTKDHWRTPSRPEFIEAGLKKFRSACARIGAPSYAFPMLGCGNGGLDFDSQVRPLMEHYLSNMTASIQIHVGRNHPGHPKQQTADRIKTRLRSEPDALPFDDVWKDLQRILDEQQEFMTWGRRTRFKVRAEQNPLALTILVAGKSRIRIYDEALIDFWQQLRSHGFSHSRIAPNHRHLYYLMPLFARLDYVRPIAVADTASSFKTNPRTALQILPPPIACGQKAASRDRINAIAA